LPARRQVALLGAAGGIGQPLGLLLKMNRHIDELNLYDLAPFTKGVAKDLSHCNTAAKVPAVTLRECRTILHPRNDVLSASR